MAAFVRPAHIDIVIRGGGKGAEPFSFTAPEKVNILSHRAVGEQHLAAYPLPEQQRPSCKKTTGLRCSFGDRTISCRLASR